MNEITEYLKSPLETCTLALLTGCQETIEYFPASLSEDVKKVASIALPILATLGAFFSIPLWIAGEVIDCFQGRGDEYFKDDTTQFVDTFENMFEDLSLSQEKTKILGFPVSTFQYTSSDRFCPKSDWGKYSKAHFNREKQTKHLSHGHGVDILTHEGMKAICDATIEAGGNTVRFSLEWSHIEGAKGEYNDVAMTRYVNAAKYIEERGLKPIIVFHHFVTPLDENGNNIFESEESIQRFVNFAEYAYSFLKDHVDHFLTFNEPKVQTVMNYILGEFPAGGFADFAKCHKTTKNMLEAHVQIYKKLHALAEGRKITVGMTHQALRFVPSSRWNFLSRIVCFAMTHLFHGSFMDWAEKHKDTLDVLGVQYYSRPYMSGFPPYSRCKEGGKMVESMDFRFDPEGILPILRDVSKRLGKGVELYVSETGTSGRSYVNPKTVEEIKASREMDERREEYFKRSVRAVKQAQDEGLNIIGYMPWGLFGNFEWAHGFSKDHDFGIIARDPKTGLTRKTPGYEVIRNVFLNTINSQSDFVDEAL